MSSFDSITTNFNRMRNEQVSDKHIQAILYRMCISKLFSKAIFIKIKNY